MSLNSFIAKIILSSVFENVPKKAKDKPIQGKDSGRNTEGNNVRKEARGTAPLGWRVPEQKERFSREGEPFLLLRREGAKRMKPGQDDGLVQRRISGKRISSMDDSWEGCGASTERVS